MGWGWWCFPVAGTLLSGVSIIQIRSEPKSPLSLFLFAIYISMCYHCSSSRGRRAASGVYHPCVRRISCFCMPCEEKTCSFGYWDCFFLQPVREDMWFHLLKLVPVSEDRCWFPMQKGGKLVGERLLDTCQLMRVPGCEPTILKAE